MTDTATDYDRDAYEAEHGVSVDLICIGCNGVWTTLDFDGELQEPECPQCELEGVRT